MLAPNGSAERDPVGKAWQVLARLIDTPDGSDRGWGVRELAQLMELPSSTVHRILSNLERHGLAIKDEETGQYRIGLEFYRLALKAQRRFALREAALPLMREFVDRCGETVFLGIYDPLRMELMFAAGVESSHPVRYVVPINEWIPVYCAASGMAIMAFLSPEERRAIIERTGLAPVTPNTITDPQELEAELARIRKRGYAFSHAQRTPGAVAIAAPIANTEGQVIGDLVLYIPEQRYDASAEHDLAKTVMHYANCVSERIGNQYNHSRS